MLDVWVFLARNLYTLTDVFLSLVVVSNACTNNIVMGMWGWSFLISPAISGALSEPLKQYPNSEFVFKFQSILEPYPFILPNLVSVLFCSIAIITIYVFVPETLPASKLQSPKNIPSDALSWVNWKLRSFSIGKKAYSSLLSASNENRLTTMETGDNAMKDAQMNHSESCSLIATATPHQYDTNTTNSAREEDASTSPRAVTDDDALSSNNGGKLLEDDCSTSSTATISSLWNQTSTRNHLATTWCYAFVAVSLDEAFPLYCISQNSGLGLSEVSIGKILSGCGLIFASVQYFIYSFIVNKYGLYKSIRIGAIFSAPLLALLPIARLLNNSNDDDETDNTFDGITWSAYVYLVLLLASYRVFSMVFFSSIAVATNRTVIPSHRGTMNGLSTLGGSVSKGLAPTFAGLLVAFALSSGYVPSGSSGNVGGFVIFGIIGLMGCITVIMSFTILDEDDCGVGSSSISTSRKSLRKK